MSGEGDSDRDILLRIEGTLGALIERVDATKAVAEENRKRVYSLEAFRWKSLGALAALILVANLVAPYIQSAFGAPK